MTATEEAALARVRAAVKGKPTDRLSYSEVRCGDIAALGALVRAERHEEDTLAIVAGATVARDDYGGKTLVVQTTEHIRRLLELVETAPTS